MENLRLAHKNASVGKHWYKEVKMVNSDVDYYLTEIQKMLQNKTYKNSEYEIFERWEGPKIRKIYKLPYFPDRIIQWALLQVVGCFIEKQFTKDTYSAIPERGPLECMLQLSRDIHIDPENTIYCLKIDIHHFYQSINHILLKKKYRRLFKDNDLLWLIDTIIDSVPENEGIPIGNYTSQYSGNLYLSNFDHWIKEVLHVKYYYRYMDDMVFLSDNKEFLHDVLDSIQKRLLSVEMLKLKSNYQIFPIADRGIDYVGFIMYPEYTLIRNRIKMNFITLCEYLWKQDVLTDHYRSALFSYLGFLQHSNTFNLQYKYYEPIRLKFRLPNMIKTPFSNK